MAATLYRPIARFGTVAGKARPTDVVTGIFFNEINELGNNGAAQQNKILFHHAKIFSAWTPVPYKMKRDKSSSWLSACKRALT